MKKNHYLYFAGCFVVVMLCACVKDESRPSASENQFSKLTVDQARAFFETDAVGLLTRAEGEAQTGVFAPGGVTPDWNSAETSENERVASVDIPVRIDNSFRVARKDTLGNFSEVSAYSKLLVVRSPQTGDMATYMHFFIPDEFYASTCDGDISEMFANSHPRGDYSGVEIYSCMDGSIAAAVRYKEGTPVAQVFMGNRGLSAEVKQGQLRSILRNMYFLRKNGGATRASDSDWWDYGGKSCFRDSRGTLYFVVMVEGMRAVTTDVDGTMGDCDDDGNTTGGKPGGGGNGGGGNGDGAPDGGDPGGVIGGDYVGNLGDGLGSGGGGGSGGNNPGDNQTDKPDKPDKPDPKDPPRVIFPFPDVDPTPYELVDWEGFRPPKPELPKAKKPCFHIDSVRANPLISMEILGTINNKKAGGRYGTARGGWHYGVDLVAEIGTPVYAMFDGKVTNVVDKYDPEVCYDDYALLYSSDEKTNRDAGNRIWIESTTSKGKVRIKYFHLHSVCVKLYQPVSAGDIVGYVGATGSACSPRSAGPHLHLETYLNGKRGDPEPYLYTQFDKEGNPTTKDCNEN